MAILIKGMKMPPDGRYTLCVTHDSNGGVHWVFQSQDTLEFLKHGDVIEVPEPHGDLVDRDDLLLKVERGDYETYNDYSITFDLIDCASTVIGAEDGE